MVEMDSWGGALPWGRQVLATVRRWAVPASPAADRYEPDLVNVMAHRPAAVRFRCVLPPLSGLGGGAPTPAPAKGTSTPRRG